MIYACTICKKIVYIEDEFVEHVKRVHLGTVEDEIVLISEMVTFYSDLKRTQRQEALTKHQIKSGTNDQFYCFYGDNGERLIFSK